MQMQDQRLHPVQNQKQIQRPAHLRPSCRGMKVCHGMMEPDEQDP